MLSIELVSIVIGVAAGVGAIVLVGIPYLKSKGINIDNVLQKSEKVLTGVDSVVTVADSILQSSPAITILNTIDKIAHVAVSEAEQLNITSKLDADQRNTKAKETIYAALKVLNVEVTPDIEKIVDGTIEAEVLALGHKTPEAAQQAATQQQLLQQNQQLTQQNAQLKQAITQFQNTVQITQ